MKTTLKQITAGAFLAILVLIGNTKVKGSEVEILKNTIETTLTLESWMINETVWNTKSIMNYEIVQEAETSLQLEYWMTSETIWNSNQNIIEETEVQLRIEDWMVKENIWNRE